jgi:hypothetical protein
MLSFQLHTQTLGMLSGAFDNMLYEALLLWIVPAMLPGKSAPRPSFEAGSVP